MAKKLKIGIIGTGGIARGCHMKGYESIPDDCEMVAVCDVHEPTAKLAAEQFNVSKIYSDYNDLLADPEIDAVSVATPNKFHLGPTVAALNAGKHVLCEKPLGMNADECREMCRAAEKNGKILQVGLQSRFGGTGRFMKDFADNGGLGDVYYARAQALRRRGVPHWGVFINKELQGGGPLIDIGVHILDFTLFLMGYPNPIAATGKTWDVLGKDPKITNNFGEYDRTKFTVEDFAVGMIRFDNGAIVTLESSFMANQEEGENMQTQLFGTKAGAIVKPWGGNESVKIFGEENKQLFNISPANVPNVASPHVAEVQAFVKAIQNGDASPVPGKCGLILNAVFDAIYKSSVTGVEEKVDVSY